MQTAWLAGFLVTGCNKSDSAPPPGSPPPTEVGVAEVVLREVTPADELTGRIEAVDQVDVRPRVSGHVTAIHHREGTAVAAGTLLFTIDARPYRAAFARASAELARATARVDLARLEAQRSESLLKANAIARAERDTAASVAAQAEAEIQAARANLELARLDLEYTQIRAPVAGRVGQAMVSIGDYVAAGPQTLLTTIVSVDPVHVYFTGDEQRYLRLSSAKGEHTVDVGLADETGFPRAGKVDFVDNKIDSATGTIRLRAVLPNPDGRLIPGLYARVKFAESGTIKALLVDDRAVMTDQDRRFVYVLAGDTVARKDVKLGRIVEGMRVIASGLAAGDRVIINNVQKVFPGAKAVVAAATAVKAAP